MTLAQLRRLRASGYHNADTGLELDAYEAEAEFWRLSQARADRALALLLRGQRPAVVPAEVTS